MERTAPPPVLDLPLPWEDRPVSRERWEQHRALLLRREIGARPPEWWVYDRGMEPPGPPHMQARMLFEMGELKGAELAQVLGWFRNFYDEGVQQLTE